MYATNIRGGDSVTAMKGRDWQVSFLLSFFFLF